MSANIARTRDLRLQGGEMTYRSLIQDALSEGNEAIASWLLDKVKTAHEGSFKDIIEEAVKNANTESEAYKPTDLAKRYWNEYFPEGEQQDLSAPDDDYYDAEKSDDYKKPKASEHFEVPRAGSPEHLALIEKQNPGTLEKWASNKMKEAAERLGRSNGHFGEEQAEGLDNLLAGLKDGPKDERW